MIFKRMVANLRAQNWSAIVIELGIVVVGVFIGTQVSNWNGERLERRETQRMLAQLVPELQSQMEFFDSVGTYFATSRRYADQALAAWNGNPQITDGQFVIAAYQASQIVGIGTNAENWALTFGGQQLRNIDDSKIRRNMELMLTSDFGPVGLNAVATPYREHVRRVIPISVQDSIRRECGDRNVKGRAGFIISTLPATCALQIAPAEASAIAASLRAEPDLVEQLNWHLAAVAVFLSNVDILKMPIQELQRDLSTIS